MCAVTPKGNQSLPVTGWPFTIHYIYIYVTFLNVISSHSLKDGCLQANLHLFLSGIRDSNSHRDLGRVECYRYTNPAFLYRRWDSNPHALTSTWFWVRLGYHYNTSASWLGYQDSNLNKQNQNLWCYRYTISQYPFQWTLTAIANTFAIIFTIQR